MSSGDVQAAEGQGVDAAGAVMPTGRRAVWAEVGVMMCVGVLPYLVQAVEIFFQTTGRASEMGVSWFELSMAFLTLPPIAWIMWKSGISWRRYGLVRWEWRVDLGLALLVIGAYWVTTLAMDSALYWLCSLVPPLTPLIYGTSASHGVVFSSSGSLAAWLVLYGMTATIEELVCRAYLITRLEELLGSKWSACVVSAAVFASYHMYQGVSATLCIFSFGLAMSLLFVLSRRTWPLIAGHVVINGTLQLFSL